MSGPGTDETAPEPRDPVRGIAGVRRGERVPGLAVAGATALVSGVSVFVNGYGVHAVSSPAVYTTAKNLVAAVVLAALALVGLGLRRARPTGAWANGVAVAPGAPRVSGRGEPTLGWRAWGALRWAGLAYVGIVGGGLAFVAFFEGLAKTSAAPAAFWRDTLVVWVALIAVPALRERLRWWNVAAVGLLVVGEVVVAGGVGHLAPSEGELLVLGSSVLWAVEVVVARVLLRDVAPAALSVVRMGIGAVTLVVYLAASGLLGTLGALHGGQLWWALWTGLLLALYVATWFTALQRARALDVTSVLVGSALLTWILELAAGSATVTARSTGLVLIALGVAVVLVAGRRAIGGLERVGSPR